MAAILCAFCKRSKTAYQPDQPTLITNATVVIGFVREGVYRELLERDDQRHDMILNGLLRPEWHSRLYGNST